MQLSHAQSLDHERVDDELLELRDEREEVSSEVDGRAEVGESAIVDVGRIADCETAEGAERRHGEECAARRGRERGSEAGFGEGEGEKGGKDGKGVGEVEGHVDEGEGG